MTDTPILSQQNFRPSLLVIEDSDEDFEAFIRVIRQLSIKNPIYRCTNGDEALDFLYHVGEYSEEGTAPRPGVILMDLNLPGTDGRDLIKQVKQDETLKSIPVVVFTTSSNSKDVEICYQYGVNSYMVKPIGIQTLKKILHDFFNYWFESVVLPNVV